MGEERKHHQLASLCSHRRMHPLLWSTGTGRLSSAGFPASKAGHPATQLASWPQQTEHGACLLGVAVEEGEYDQGSHRKPFS